MADLRELELTCQHMERRLQAVEAAVQTKAIKSAWLSPCEAARQSNGQYTDYQIRTKVDSAIAEPTSTQLLSGVHFTKTRTSKRWVYKVHWPKFGEVWAQEAYQHE
jgi:hypothetical protein